MTKARDIASAAPAPSTVSATELGYLDGVSSAIQTQIDGKQAANANVSTTELGYLDGVTSAIQTQLDAKIPKTLTTTTGDIIYASSANTPARLGIGSTSQVLTVSGGVPSWSTPSSGGMTLISTTTLSGSSISLTSIPQTYIHLQLIIEKYVPSTDGQSMFMRFNGNSSSNQYLSNQAFTGDIDNSVCDATEMRVTGSQSNSSGLGQITINIPNYTNANTRKFMWATSLFNSNTEASARIDYWQRNGYFLPVEAITSISLRPFNPNFSGGTAYLYGVK